MEPAVASSELFISREQINRLPLTSYNGPIHLIDTPERAQAALERLRSEAVLGFDTESRPSFTREVSYPPALVQLAGAEAVWLFQLAPLRGLGGLSTLLADGRVLKAGVALTDDVKKLIAIEPFEPAGFVELATLADACHIRNNGLRGLLAACLGVRISKNAQRSNWGRRWLAAEQIRYAATDAWASREVYCHLARQATPEALAAAMRLRLTPER